MKDFIRKTLIILLMAGAFAWLAYISVSFWDFVTIWRKMVITNAEFVVRIVIFLVKSIPVFVALVISRHYWDY